MADNNAQPLFTVHTDLELSEYKKYVRAMQGSQLKSSIIAVIVCLWLLAAGVYNIYSGKTVLGFFMAFVAIVAPILVRVTANNQTERDYKHICEAGGNSFEVNFYEDHFETKNSTSHGVHEYDKLFNVVESDSGFYLEIEQGHSVIIEKKYCSEELIAFLRKLEK